MEVTYTPAQEAFSPEEPVEVRLRITHIGEADFTFIGGGRQRGARDNQFAFTAQVGDKMVPDFGNPVSFMGLEGTLCPRGS